MRILFVTRKYPPSTGGLENAAYEFHKALAAHGSNKVTLVKWGGSNKLLPMVYIWLLAVALRQAFLRRPDIIYLQDGLMAPLGWILKLLVRRPTLITVHGKEATYANPLYKLMVPPFVRRQDRLVTISNDTQDAARKAFPGMHPILIPHGVADSFYSSASRSSNVVALADAVGVPVERLQAAKLLHSNGRLVRRKGVLWFVDNVLPRLVADDASILYVVSGDGRDRGVIEAAVAKHNLGEHVRLLGRVPQSTLNLLYNTANLFVMPNVPVVNDMEGLGLVALEAASCGTLVVASNLEGIPDAVHDAKNGVLVTPSDVEGYVRTIKRELTHPSISRKAVREYTLNNFGWDRVAQRYETVFRQLIDQPR